MKSLSPWESRPERPERVCIKLVVFILPLALPIAAWNEMSTKLQAIHSEKLLVNVDATVKLIERNPFVGAVGLFNTSGAKHD